MNEFLRFWGLVVLVVVVFSFLTVYLMKKFKTHPIYKYIPTISIWIISALFFIYAVFFAEPMQDLGYFVMSMITGIATFIVLVITIVIDNIQKKKRKKI